MAAPRTYLAIDLKSFYASVECVDRHLDPLTTLLFFHCPLIPHPDIHFSCPYFVSSLVCSFYYKMSDSFLKAISFRFSFWENSFDRTVLLFL